MLVLAPRANASSRSAPGPLAHCGVAAPHERPSPLLPAQRVVFRRGSCRRAPTRTRPGCCRAGVRASARHLRDRSDSSGCRATAGSHAHPVLLAARPPPSASPCRFPATPFRSAPVPPPSIPATLRSSMGARAPSSRIAALEQEVADLRRRADEQDSVLARMQRRLDSLGSDHGAVKRACALVRVRPAPSRACAGRDRLRFERTPARLRAPRWRRGGRSSTHPNEEFD